MNKFRCGLCVLGLLVVPSAVLAQRQMEKLGRGIVAVRTGPGTAYVGWRLLGTDAENVGFNIFRSVNGAAPVQLNGSLIANSCNFNDSTINFAVSNAYFIQPVGGGVTQALSGPFGLGANPPTQQYLNIPLQQPAGGTTADGVPYTYNANDCSAADLDGDGEYEIVLKWDPTNSKDNSQSGFTGNVFLDAYKLNGTRLWRIDLGQNIRAGAHYTQFMVYDLDGDGRAELACKTAPGTKDGLGNYVDGNAAFTVYTNSAGYILSGPEYFTIFDGLTGTKLWNTNYIVPRGNVSDWGDGYGNRVDRFLACVAYLDGVRPSVVMCRGYYTRATLCAWDWRNGVLTQRWLFDTGFSGGPWSGYKGQGAHSLTVGDVDGDGKDEITYGACAIDDNGTGLYTTLLGHGDALHQSDMNPDRNGFEVWMVHEDPGSYGPTGLEFRDAKSGGLIFGVDGQNADVGRGVAMDVDPNYRGYEMWGARGGFMSATGVQIGTTKPTSQNFACYWDADLLREPLDGTTIYKWNPASSTTSTIFSGAGIASNNSTKSTPNLSVDLFGDWREEVIWRTSDNLNLRIYTTTIVATNRLVTLMHDPAYRVAIAWQNVAYNQPPHPGYYIGPGMYPPPVPPISSADLVWRGGGANVWDPGVTANWFTNGIWVSNNTAVAFANGRSVLFDLSGSNNTAINITSVGAFLSPGAVTVHSAKDYTFAGSGSLSGAMKLVKAGPARLTINNTNDYTGGTFVSGGALFVNGALKSSAVTVERRGTPEGPSQFGGSGRLGNGLIVQAGCVLTVGAETNLPGTLTVTNGLTLLGARNQFDFSNDSSGISKTNDVVWVVGNLALSGTNTIEIRQLDGFLNGGVYPLITYTGTLSGGLTNLVLSGSFIQPVALTNPPGMIGLLAVIPAAPPTVPGGLVATAVGAYQINLVWTDNSSDENAFVIERSTSNPANFAQIAINPANDTNYSDMTVAPNTTYYYRVRGTNLAGASTYSNTNSATTTPPPTVLTWRGDGAGNVWDVGGVVNWSDGANLVVYNDGATVTFDQSGSNNVAVLLNGALRPASVTVNASKNYTLNATNGFLAGAMVLTKSGSGTLTLSSSNGFSGGVNVNAGNVTLGNVSGAGSGAIRFNGGTVSLVVGNQQTYANPLAINSNSTLLSQGGNNNIVNGTWSGSNVTFNISVASGTFTVGGSMTNFPGTVSLGTSAGFFRFNGSAGGPNTSFDLGTGTATLNNRNGVTVILGALSGGSGTSLAGAGDSAGGASTYRIGSKNLSTTFNGTIKDATAVRYVNLNKIGSGTWTITGTNTYTGTTIVSAGKLVLNGNQSTATGAVTVNSGATLGGIGIVGGNTTVNGSLAPGASIGTLTFSQNLTFGATGTAQFEISKNPFSNDAVVVAGNVAYGGTLDVLNTSVELLEAGDNFQLFSAGSYSGTFASYDLPALEDGLAWNVSQLAVDGRLWVVNTNPPVINSIAASGGNFFMSGIGGTPNWNYSVLTTTNLSQPLAQWSVVASGQFDGSGNFSFSSPMNSADAQRFYVLQAQ